MSFGGWLKRTAFWTNDYLHGKRVRVFYDDIKKVLLDSEEGGRIQQKHLNMLLEHAVNHSPYYKKYKNCKLNEFPVVNKAVLIENYEQICVPIKEIPGQIGDKVHVQRTSGSTGTPFAVPQDTRKRNRRIAELKYYNEIVGMKSHEKLGQCRIWTKWQSKSKWQSFRENIIPINVTRMDDETIEYLLKIVKKYRIIALRAYASWYDALVEYLEQGKGNPNDLHTLKVCLSSSEALSEETRKKMLEIAGVPIVEAYASEEAGVMAQQRIGDTNYYLNHSGYVFEFMKMDEDVPCESGELGRIVITDLFNYAFPMIRYDTGDTAVWHEGTSDSNGWIYISRLYGRRLDLVYNTKGVPLHPMNFARILKNFKEIIQWQFIQKGEKEYVVRLNMKKESNLGNDIIKELKNIIGADADIKLELVNEIPVLASGKRKSVICEWRKE